MKRIVLIIFLFPISLLLFSQTNNIFILGISGGVTYSNIKEIEVYDIPENYNYKFGISGGLGLELKLKSKFDIETNIDLYQNGFETSYKQTIRTNNYTATESYIGYNYQITQNYLNNSWIVGYQIGNKIFVKTDLGLYCAIYLSSRINKKEYSYIDSLEWIEIGDPSLPMGYEEDQQTYKLSKNFRFKCDLGLIGKITLGYYLNNKYQINCFIKYYKGLKDIDRDIINVNKKYNNSFCFGLGLKMKM